MLYERFWAIRSDNRDPMLYKVAQALHRLFRSLGAQASDQALDMIAPNFGHLWVLLGLSMTKFGTVDAALCSQGISIDRTDAKRR